MIYRFHTRPESTSESEPVDDHRVQQMAREYSMNYSTARRLLEDARDVPALRIGRRYREMMGGDAGEQENTEAVPGTEEGTGADRPGNRALAGAGGEHPDSNGEGHWFQP